MNDAAKKLLPAIASFAHEKNAYLSKTKLLKLLYLFDVEYYRLHQKTFTGFQWKFFHLGPWTNEFDPLLQELESAGDLVSKSNSHPEFDSKNYVAPEHHDIGKLFTSLRDESILKRVLNLWVERSVGEILDYVYFHTEPMEHGIRNTPLDFALISTQTVERYARPSSNTPPSELAKKREAFRKRQAELRSDQGKAFEFTPPRYDEEFFQAISKLDQHPA